MGSTPPSGADPRTAAVNRREVAGLPFSVLPLAEAIALVVDLGRNPPAGPPGVAVHFGNAYSIALADSDPTYRRVLRRSDLLATDGTPVVWAGRRLHPDAADRWTRVYGPDVMAGVLAASAPDGPRHYLVGGSPSTLAALQAKIAARWPEAVVVGSESPPFRPESAAELAARDERITASGATCVWVGLGTPKQDHEARRLADRHAVTVLAVGAAFDFLAGTVRQAPVWMQHGGMEWAFRWSVEPRRLTHRYVWGNPRFAWAVGRQAVGRRADRVRP